MVTRVEVVVVGGGAMGSAAAWQLARRGHEVLLLERFEPGHARGASHGATRNFNLAYAEDTYADLVSEARDWWDELAAETGETLLDLVGLANHGWTREFDAIEAAVRSRGRSVERLDPAEAAKRWRGMRFAGEVLSIPEAGRVRAAAALRALRTSASRQGAEIRYNTPVAAIEPVTDEVVHVRTADERWAAHRVVVTVGAWTEKLLGHLMTLPRLVVTQQQPAHFRVLDTDAVWPSFNHFRDPDEPAMRRWPTQVYGMLSPGEGVKAGWHGAGPVIDPDNRSFLPEAGPMEALRQYVRDWLPGADPDQFEPISCTYTSTDTEDFVIDRVGPIVVGAGFSGHGFKFTPAIGRVLADLIEGGTSPDLFRREPVRR